MAGRGSGLHINFYTDYIAAVGSVSSRLSSGNVDPCFRTDEVACVGYSHSLVFHLYRILFFIEKRIFPRQRLYCQRDYIYLEKRRRSLFCPPICRYLYPASYEGRISQCSCRRDGHVFSTIFCLPTVARKLATLSLDMLVQFVVQFCRDILSGIEQGDAGNGKQQNTYAGYKADAKITVP